MKIHDKRTRAYVEDFNTTCLFRTQAFVHGQANSFTSSGERRGREK